jgi:hypothetical protein
LLIAARRFYVWDRSRRGRDVHRAGEARGKRDFKAFLSKTFQVSFSGFPDQVLYFFA